MRNRLLTVISLLSLAAAACSRGGGGKTPSPSTTVSKKDVSGVVLQQSDFPEGWTSSPAKPSTPEDAASNRKFSQCLGVPYDPGDDDATSPDFSLGDTTTAANTANVLSAKELESTWAAFQGAKLLPCVKQNIDASLASESGGTKYSPAVATNFAYPQVGDGAKAVRATTNASANGQTVTLYFEFILIRTGPVGITLRTFNVGQPFPTDLAAELGQKLVDRAAA